MPDVFEIKEPPRAAIKMKYKLKLLSISVRYLIFLGVKLRVDTPQ